MFRSRRAYKLATLTLAKPSKDNIPLIQSDLLTLMQGAEFDELNAARWSKARFIKQIEKSVNNMFKDGPKPFEMERAMITGFVIQ